MHCGRWQQRFQSGATGCAVALQVPLSFWLGGPTTEPTNHASYLSQINSLIVAKPTLRTFEELCLRVGSRKEALNLQRDVRRSFPFLKCNKVIIMVSFFKRRLSKSEAWSEFHRKYQSDGYRNSAANQQNLKKIDRSYRRRSIGSPSVGFFSKVMLLDSSMSSRSPPRRVSSSAF